VDLERQHFSYSMFIFLILLGVTAVEGDDGKSAGVLALEDFTDINDSNRKSEILLLRGGGYDTKERCLS